MPLRPLLILLLLLCQSALPLARICVCDQGDAALTLGAHAEPGCDGHEDHDHEDGEAPGEHHADLQVGDAVAPAALTLCLPPMRPLSLELIISAPLPRRPQTAGVFARPPPTQLLTRLIL